MGLSPAFVLADGIDLESKTFARHDLAELAACVR